jgi:hypothetical protein
MLTSCTVCNGYLERRLTPVVREIVLVQGHREDAFERIVRYVRKVHERHMAGLSLGAPLVQRDAVMEIAGRYSALIAAVTRGDDQ